MIVLVLAVAMVLAEDDFGPRPRMSRKAGGETTAGRGNHSGGGGGGMKKNNNTLCIVSKSSDGFVNGTTMPLWGTLRRCITICNKLDQPGRIEFAVKQKNGHNWNVTINLTSPLPPLNNPMVIDATTQPPPVSPSPSIIDLPRVIISGQYVKGCYMGLDIKAPDVTIIGLGVTGFLGAGIMVSAPRLKIIGGAVYGNTMDSGQSGDRRARRDQSGNAISGDDAAYDGANDAEYDDDDSWTHMNKNYDDDDWWAPGWQCDQTDSVMYTRIRGGIVVEETGVNASLGGQPAQGQASPQTLYVYDNNVGPGVITAGRWTTLTNAWVGIRPDGSKGPCGTPRFLIDNYQGWGVLNSGGVHVLGHDMTIGTDGGVQRTYVGNNLEVGILVRGANFFCVNTAVGLNPVDGSNASNIDRGIYLADTARSARIGQQGSHNRTWVAWHGGNGISSTAPDLVIENSAIGLRFDGSPAPNDRGVDILTTSGINTRIGSLRSDANLTYISNSNSSAIKSHAADMVVAACAVGFTFNGSVAANEYGLYIEGPRALVGAGQVRSHIGGSLIMDVYSKATLTRIEHVAVGLDFEMKSVSQSDYLLYFDVGSNPSYIGKDGAPFRSLVDVPQKFNALRDYRHDGNPTYDHTHDGNPTCICAIYVASGKLPTNPSLTIVNAQIGLSDSIRSMVTESGVLCASIGTAVHGGILSNVQIGVDGSPNRTFVLQQVGDRDAIKFIGQGKIVNAWIGISPDGLPRKRIYNQDSFGTKGNLVSIETTEVMLVQIGGKLNKTYLSDSWGSGLVVRSGSATVSNVAIGLGPDGKSLPNLGDYGVHLFDKARLVELKESWISGNAGTGVLVEGSATSITNCSIGLGFDGKVQSNGRNGIEFGSGADATTMNTTVISGNKLVGVVSSAPGLIIGSGCNVGVDHRGECAGNGGVGIQLASHGIQVGVEGSNQLPVLVGCNQGVGIDATHAVDAQLNNVHIFGDGITGDDCDQAGGRTATTPTSNNAAAAVTQLVGIVLGKNSTLGAGCIVKHADGTGVVVVGQGNTISASLICSNGGNGVSVASSGQVVINSGSKVSHNALDGINSDNGGVWLHNVTIMMNAGNGVLVVGKNSIAVPNNAAVSAKNCTISENKQSGMLLVSVVHGTITNSTFADNRQQAGLVLNSSESTEIEGCYFARNSRYGIWVRDTCTTTSITSCTVVGSSRSAMRNDAQGTSSTGNQFLLGNNRNNNACNNNDFGEAPCTCSSSSSVGSNAGSSPAIPGGATIECKNRLLDFGLDFPHIWKNTTKLTVTGVDLITVPWTELAALEPGLVSLDLSHNPQLNSIPPVGVVLPSLENLDLSATDISTLQNDSFFAGFKNLGSLDLSGALKIPSKSDNLQVNFTGLIQKLQTVFWFSSDCPPGYWIASETNSVCTACPVGTWKPYNGPLQSDCKKCASGTYDHDADPTTECLVIEHFEVSSFQRADNVVLETPAKSALTWAVNDPVTISAVVTLQKVHASSGGKVSFVANGLPNGLLIDTKSGMIAGSPLKGPSDLRGDLQYNVSLYARDEQAGFAKLEDITVTVRYKDAADPRNGPNGKGCLHGITFDSIPFDQRFTCNCRSVSSSWTGSNCSKPANPWIVIGSILGSILFLVGSGFICITVRRYRQRSKPYSFENSLTALAADGIVTMESSVPGAQGASSEVIMMGTFGEVSCSSGSLKGGALDQNKKKKSVGPSYYNNAAKEVAKTPREIPSSRLTLLKIVGSGAGGVVRSAMLNEPGTPAFMCVVKSPLAGASDQAREALLHEAALMAQFRHPNVVSLIGVVTKFKNSMLVLQICDNGSLHSLLTSGAYHPGKEDVSSKCVLGIASDVATGMKYLSQRHFVHRDVAARNILVAADWICRVADFGLSRKLSQKEYYYVRSNSEDAFPLRWSAPEVVSLGHFSSKADVWSFGVLLFEVIARGNQPFKSCSNIQLVELLASGGGASIQKALPCLLQGGGNLAFVKQRLILTCLVTKLEDRPSFETLLTWIDDELHGNTGSMHYNGDDHDDFSMDEKYSTGSGSTGSRSTNNSESSGRSAGSGRSGSGRSGSSGSTGSGSDSGSLDETVQRRQGHISLLPRASFGSDSSFFSTASSTAPNIYGQGETETDSLL